jgi:HK97 family phage portal protein
MNPLVKSLQAINAGLKRFSMQFSRSASVSWGYLLGRTRYDYAGIVGDGTGNSAVMACLGWIGRTFPEAPVMVQRPQGTDYEPIAGHPLVELLEQPNPFYSGSVLWAATLTSYHADGNAYWLKERSAAGRVVALWYTPHTLIDPVSESSTAFVEYYRYRVNGQEIRLDPADVVHFRNGLDPENPRKGLAPLKSALREVFADDEAALFFGALMRNMGIPGVLISPDSDGVELQQGDADVIKASFEERFGGDNRGRPLVMNGKTKVEVLSFSPEQMNLRELRRLPEERITAVLGIPAIVAGLGAGLDRSTFANYAEAREAAWEDNIIPTQRIIAADLKTQLLRDFDDNPKLRVAFDNSGIRVLQPDQTAIVTRTITAVQAGVMRVDEGRREIGLDAGPEHEFYLIPAGYEVRKELEAPEPEPVELPPPGLRAITEGTEGDEEPPEPILRLAAARKDRKDSLARLRHQQAEKRLLRELRAYFADQARAVVRAYERTSKAQGDDLLGPEWDDLLRDLALEFFSDQAALVAGDVGATLGLPDLAQLAADRYGETVKALAERVTNINETTREQIARIVKDGLTAGEHPRVIARSLTDLFTDMKRSRAETIARTETANVMNLSAIDAYEASGVVTAVKVLDGDFDEECARVNGQTWSFAQARANPIAHPRCVRAYAPVVA